MKSENDKERQQENKREVEIDDLPVEACDAEEITGGDNLGKTYYVGTANGGVWK